MTLVEVLAIVKDHTGADVTPETELSTLGMDSLELLDLLVRIGNIQDEAIPHLNTIRDLYAAANGAVYEADGLWHKHASWNGVNEVSG